MKKYRQVYILALDSYIEEIELFNILYTYNQVLM